MTNLETRFPDLKQMQGVWEPRYKEFLNQLAEIPKAYGPLFVMSFLGAISGRMDALLAPRKDITNRGFPYAFGISASWFKNSLYLGSQTPCICLRSGKRVSRFVIKSG